MYLEKRTVITLLIVLAVVGGGIAFVAFHPAAKQATEKQLIQSDLESRPVAPNPNDPN